MEGLADRLRAAADALGPSEDLEAGWLRGAAALVDRGEAERTSARAAAVWLEELAPEGRARKAALLTGWVAAAEALRSAIHVHESERGPLVEALFPAWRGASLRRHLEQALAAEAELQRRLASAYVVRRLGERATEAALRPALQALEVAGSAWVVERDRPALSGAEADEVRGRLLALAADTTRTLDRVRAIVRAALAGRPELVDLVFPRRTTRAADTTAAAHAETPADVPANGGAGPGEAGTGPTAAAPPAAPEGEPAATPAGRDAAASPAGPDARPLDASPAATEKRPPARRSPRSPVATSNVRPDAAGAAAPDASSPRNGRGRSAARASRAGASGAGAGSPPGREETRSPATPEPRSRPGARVSSAPSRRAAATVKGHVFGPTGTRAPSARVPSGEPARRGQQARVAPGEPERRRQQAHVAAGAPARRGQRPRAAPGAPEQGVSPRPRAAPRGGPRDGASRPAGGASAETAGARPAPRSPVTAAPGKRPRRS